MNLLDQPRDQVKDCIAWMRRVSDTSPPSPAMWAEVCEGLQEHALFLEAFVLGKIAPVQRHLFEGREKTDPENFETAAADARSPFALTTPLPPSDPPPLPGEATPPLNDNGRESSSQGFMRGAGR